MVIQTKIRLYILVGFLSLLSAGYSAKLVTHHLIVSSEWVAHTYNVEYLLEKIISQLDNAETGQRGYLLTGKISYLAPYELGKREIYGIIEKTKNLTSDNSIQQERIEQITTLTAAKLGELSETIELHKAGDHTGALDVIATDRGKQIMDEIRSIVDEMNYDELQLLEERKQESALTILRVTWITSFGSLLAFSIVCFIVLILGRDIHRYIKERNYAMQERDNSIEKLELALLEIKTLKGIIPICSYCKVVRNDEGAWEKMEAYISAHSDAKFSHGICPKCLEIEREKLKTKID